MTPDWLYQSGLVVVHPGAPGQVIVQDPTLPVAGLLRLARVGGSVNPGGSGALLPARRVLFFESLMNSDMPHNDTELSQGVLHMISTLRPEQVVLANVKMAIIGGERPVIGLDTLTVEAGIDLVCITLLEGYWDGVVALIAELRARGCRAHVAVGGVMPTLTPEHVAAHLPDVSFVCRGAGEYFVPRLAAILGGADIDTPFSPAQLTAFLGIDGLIAIDRAAGRLVSSNANRTITVDDLDGVHLDLRWITPRHLVAGVELSTSRGCVHRCTFCSILGRESYQARSAEGVLALLGRYDAHYTELFGAGPCDRRGRNTLAPGNAYRVHISDDDFACDKARAIALFRGLLATPFRLSSCQVSIADLCRREGVLLPEPDPELFAALVPELFDDFGASIPARDYVADHQTRAWSSYLQIGVETFSDRELARLGKGYKRAHIRSIVDALARRRIHHDAYFILSNADTRPEDLVEVLDEVVRLKLRYPIHFHIRFPVVPRLVSYFPSASYKRRLRTDGARACTLRALACVPGYPELDYPFVEHDTPCDIVDRAVAGDFFTDQDWYGGSYVKLREVALALSGPEAEHLARVCDDRLRRRLFELLDAARRAGRAPEADPLAPSEAHARALCEAHLGPIEGWLTAFSRYTQGGVTRLVVIPTWQCELRCNYCYIPKQDGRVMSPATIERAVGLLLSSERSALTLQFFGGEALMEWGLVQHAIEWGTAAAELRGKTLDFVVSSNGVSLDAERLAWLRAWPVRLELSLDGDATTQRALRPALTGDSYLGGIAGRAAEIIGSGVVYDVIMVVHPTQVHRLCHNFFHIVELGFRRIQINYALGKLWTVAQRTTFAEQLHQIGRAACGTEVVFVNAEHAPMPMRLNAEITVDWDGTLYGGNAFLHETEHKDRFRRGHLDDRHNFDRYWMDAPANTELVAWSYPPDVTANNLKVGAILTDFVRWWRS